MTKTVAIQGQASFKYAREKYNLLKHELIHKTKTSLGVDSGYIAVLPEKAFQQREDSYMLALTTTNLGIQDLHPFLVDIADLEREGIPS